MKKQEYNVRFLLAGAALIFLTSHAVALAGIIHVDDDAPASGNGVTWDTAFRYLQDALDVSTNGDEIRLAGGVYTPDMSEAGQVAPEERRGATFVLVNGVKIYGGYAGIGANNPDSRNIDTHTSILSGDLDGDDLLVPCSGDSPECDMYGGMCVDGNCIISQNNEENSYHVAVAVNLDNSSVLDGVAITGGNANGDDKEVIAAGGISIGNSSLIIRNCIFSRNSAIAAGGAMVCFGHCSPTLENCHFISNSVSGEKGFGGGGLFNYDNSNPTLSNCTFSYNLAAGSYHFGGGVCNLMNSNPELFNCVFLNNAASGANGGGGGMYSNSSSPVIHNCSFFQNIASAGGGISNYNGSNTQITNSLFGGNMAFGVPDFPNGGGAIMNASNSNATIVNCTIVGNTAHFGGAVCYAQNNEPAWMSNCIIWNNTPAEIQVGTNEASVTLEYCNVQGGTGESWFGAGCIDIYPFFVDPDGADNDLSKWEDNDFRIAAGSPCINTGINNAFPEGLTNDLDGHARVFCNVVDIGAYEFGLGDVDCDRDIDSGDFDNWQGCMTGPLNHYSDPLCKAFDSDNDKDVDLEDFGEIQHVYFGITFNKFGDFNLDGDVDLADYIYFPDCMNGPETLPSPPQPTTPSECLNAFDFDSDFDVDLVDAGSFMSAFTIDPPDCNSNSLPDCCDIDCGPSFGPCDVPGCGQSQDCQRNGIPDECEIADGTSQDMNGNNVPDECETQRLFVDDDSSVNTNGLSWETAFNDLQSALDLARASGGVITEIWVASGTYYPSAETTPGDTRSATFKLFSGISIYGGFTGNEDPETFDLDERDFTSNVTVLSGDLSRNDVGTNGREENSFHVVSAVYYNQEAECSILDGFSITGGNAFGEEYTTTLGGGIHCRYSELTIENCTIYGNTALDGAGISCSNSSLDVRKSTFSDNRAFYGGGGVNCNAHSDMTIIECTFRQNTARLGGGISCNDYGRVTLSGCTITSNSAESGGGFYCTSDGGAALKYCDFRENIARSSGGGINCSFTHALISNCTMTNNRAYSGAGVSCSHCLDIVLVNCVLSKNKAFLDGGGLFSSWSTPAILNCTIAWNSALYGGGTCFIDDNAMIKNSVLWHNQSKGLTGTEITVDGNSLSLTVAWSNIQYGEAGVDNKRGSLNWGPGNITVDPGFAFTGDWHLTSGSPCIDAASNEVILSDLLDLDNDGDTSELSPLDIDSTVRFIDDISTIDTGEAGTSGMPIVDMGAHEFDPTHPSLSLSEEKIEFNSLEGGQNPPYQQLKIRNSGGGSLHWEITEDCPWLQANPETGSSSGEMDDVVLQVDIVGLTHGEYKCSLIVSDSSATNSPQEVEITLYVNTTLRVRQDYATIQEAINASVHGDIILVESGTYTGRQNKNLDFRGLKITLRSENGPQNSVIDCEGSGRGFCLYSNEGPDSKIDGFTITNGYVDDGGGGINCNLVSPTISNCIIKDCTAFNSSGGGMYIIGDAKIDNCIIQDNNTVGEETQQNKGYGGGIQILGNAHITDCTFRRNVAYSNGGAISCEGITIKRCFFSQNTSQGGYGGGGINCNNSLISACQFINNEGGRGGGIRATGNSTVSECKISGNLSSVGGGVDCSGNSLITNSLISCNRVSNVGGGIYSANNLTIANCTISSNQAPYYGGGLYINNTSTSTVMTNCIFWNNQASQVPEIKANGSTPLVTFCNIRGGWAGTGNIGELPIHDPLFVRDPDDGGDGWGDDPATPEIDEGSNDDYGDLHQLLGSPVNDAGNNTAVPFDSFDLDNDDDMQELIPFDLDGGLRFRDDPTALDTGIVSTTGLPIVDMGAFETSDCNDNGINDWLDILSGSSLDEDSNGIPDECSFWDNDQGDGNWGTPLNWYNNEIPGISVEPEDVVENVVIDLPGTSVLLDIASPVGNVTVDSVTIGNTSTLNITDDYDLTIDGFAGIQNHGTIMIGNNRSITTSVLTEFGGSRPIILNGENASISSLSISNIITNTGAIEGTGKIVANLNNQGTILANANGGTLSIEGGFPKVSDGLIAATSNGVLNIVTGMTGNGFLEASHGGTLNITGVTVENYSLDALEGSIRIENAIVSLNNGIDEPPGIAPSVSGEIWITSSTVNGADGLIVRDGITTLETSSVLFISEGPVDLCPDLVSDPTAVAELNISDSGSRVAATDLDMCANAELIVEGTLELIGSFSFSNTNSAEWTWGVSSVLHMTGGEDAFEFDPAGYVQLEVGGEDLGDEPAGFVNNFQLEELQIGPEAHVMLMDLVDNGNRGGTGGQAEALYVETLRFDDTQGRLNLAGLHLYYNTIDPPSATSQILDFPSAVTKRD